MIPFGLYQHYALCVYVVLCLCWQATLQHYAAGTKDPVLQLLKADDNVQGGERDDQRGVQVLQAVWTWEAHVQQCMCGQ